MDIGELTMTQRMRVDIDPASGIGQWALTNEVRGNLWRHHVQHVEGFSAGFSAAIGKGADKGGALVGAIHLHKTVAVIEVYTVLVDVGHQGRHVIGNTEQHSAGIEEAGFDIA
ncbi:hypothetical protein D3C81_1403490 [compost metagenome]